MSVQTESTDRSVPVVGVGGEQAGTAELPARLFDAQVNVPLIHQVVVAQQAAARQGTHSTKTRTDVRGGGAKPWRQKGTGRARQGSRRAPQWTGGGIAHGPHPRDYAQRTPKKMVAAALRGALSDRARDGRLFVVTSLVEGDEPSTAAAQATLLAAVGAESTRLDRRVLVVLDREEDLDWLSVRNLVAVHAIAVDQLNAYDVLVAEDIVFSRAALAAFVSGGRGATAQATESEAESVSVSGDPAVEQDEPADEPQGVYRGETPPEGFDIKGNEDSMKFHAPSSPWYDRTIAEVWFDSAESAEAAGFVNAEGAEGAEGADSAESAADEAAEEDK